MSATPTTARPKFVYFDMPRQPRPVGDRNADQRMPEGLEQRRQKPVHAFEGGQAQEDVAAECLEPAGRVRAVVVQQRLPQPVGEFGREPPRPANRAASCGCRRPAATGSPACPGSFQQARDLGRVVLPVAVHRHDPRRACRADAGDQRRRLAAAPVVAQHAGSRRAAPAAPAAVRRSRRRCRHRHRSARKARAARRAAGFLR